MKESGKLLELLNEYSPEDFNWFEKDGKIYDRQEMYDEADVLVEMGVYIISKQFGFIKWLVENDKININEEWNDYEKINLYCNSDFFQLQKHYSYYESLLMLLSISSSPIEDLISYLK